MTIQLSCTHDLYLDYKSIAIVYKMSTFHIRHFNNKKSVEHNLNINRQSIDNKIISHYIIQHIDEPDVHRFNIECFRRVGYEHVKDLTCDDE